MSPWEDEFVEQVGLLLDVGLPRSVSRVFAWLVVSEPQHQSAEQIRATLKLSAGSVSAAVTTLARSGIINRVTFAGERRIYYQLQADAWPRLLRSRVDIFTQVRRVTERALAGAGAGEHGDERLRGMRDFFVHLESVCAGLLDRDANPSAKPSRRRSAKTSSTARR